MEDPAERRVLELLRDDAPKVAPRERPDRCADPGLRMLEELCRALNGEGSELSAQIKPVRAARKAAVQKVLDELAERDARAAEG